MSMQLAVTLLSLATVAQGLFLVLLYRQVGLNLLKRAVAINRDGPNLGARLPPALVTAAEHHQTILRSDGAWSTLLIIFARRTCHACEALWPELKTFTASHPDVAVFIVLSSKPEAAPEYRLKHTLQYPIAPDPKEQLFEAGLVRVSPFAIATDTTYTVRRKGLVNNQDHLRFLTSPQDLHDVKSTGVPFTNRRSDAIELAR